MSTKIRQSLIKCFIKIADDTFDEETIRALLIIAREHIKHEGLLRELAHFIAHSDRNQGMFHRLVNSRYAKLKLIDEQHDLIIKEDQYKSITTEQELGDRMLSGISLHKVPSKIFKILYEDGLDDLDEELLKKTIGLSIYELSELLKSYYTPKSDGFHYLITVKSRAYVTFAIENRSRLGDDPEINGTIAEQIQQIEKVERIAKNIVQTIRGTVTFRSVFATHTFCNDVLELIENLCKKFKIDQQYVTHVERNIEQILLCVMTLLHDSRFVFYDKTTAKTYLGFYLDKDIENRKNENNFNKEDFYQNATVALFTACPNIKFPLFVSQLRLRDYVSPEQFNAIEGLGEFSECPWITAERVDDKLMLVENAY